MLITNDSPEQPSHRVLAAVSADARLTLGRVELMPGGDHPSHGGEVQ